MLETIGVMGAVEIIGIIAFAVTVLTELLKGIGAIDEIPTKLLAIILGLIVATCYSAITFTAFSMQIVVFTASVGFAGAFVAIFGWDTLSEIWNRLGKGEQ